MKASVAVLTAAAGLVMAKPMILNSSFDVQANQNFVLKFSGCEGGCKIELLNGEPPNGLKVVQTLVEKTNGGDSADIKLSDKFPTDSYVFRVTDEDGEDNYSDPFTFEGTAVETTSTEETSTVAETTTSAEKSSTSLVTLTTDTETLTTPEPSTTETESATTTNSDDAQETTSDSDNDSGDAAVRLGSSHVTLAAAVVALAGYLL